MVARGGCALSGTIFEERARSLSKQDEGETIDAADDGRGGRENW